MRFHPAQALGSRAYHHISRIWYKSLVFHLAGVTHPNYAADILAFSLIVYLAVQWNQFQMPSLFRTIVRDATIYFLVIFTSHLVLELTLIFGRVWTFPFCSIFFSFAETFVAFNATTPWRVSNTGTYFLRSLTGSFSVEQWNRCVRLNIHSLRQQVGLISFIRYLPMMITRLMLSLKKASTSQEEAWSIGEPTMRFAEPRPVVVTSGEIHLDTFANESVGVQSRV